MFAQGNYYIISQNEKSENINPEIASKLIDEELFELVAGIRHLIKNYVNDLKIKNNNYSVSQVKDGIINLVAVLTNFKYGREEVTRCLVAVGY